MLNPIGLIGVGANIARKNAVMRVSKQVVTLLAISVKRRYTEA